MELCAAALRSGLRYSARLGTIASLAAQGTTVRFRPTTCEEIHTRVLLCAMELCATVLLRQNSCPGAFARNGVTCEGAISRPSGSYVRFLLSLAPLKPRCVCLLEQYRWTS